jgi:hypothetical protein
MVSVVASETKKWALLDHTACHLTSYKKNVIWTTSSRTQKPCFLPADTPQS